MGHHLAHTSCRRRSTNQSIPVAAEARDFSFAVLFDGENIGPEAALLAIARITAPRKVAVRRVYCSPAEADGWAEHGFHGVYTAIGAAKNAADIALVVDAMELALRGRIDGFVIATPDSDSTRLALWLRENGSTVFGVGEEKTPARLRRC